MLSFDSKPWSCLKQSKDTCPHMPPLQYYAALVEYLPTTLIKAFQESYNLLKLCRQ